MLRDTTTRVSRNTPDRINERIARCADQGPEAIDHRLAELDQEWDIERTLEANAASLMLVGLGLGSWADRRFCAIPATVAAFLLQHAAVVR